MVGKRFQFGISHLLAVTTVAAAVLTAILYLPTTYETDGSPNIFWLLALPFVVLALLGLWSKGLRKATCVAILVVCCAFSFRQARLMTRYRNLQEEVTSISAYVERVHTERGEYPEDLASYKFLRPELEGYIRFEPARGGDLYANRIPDPYRIRFHPTHESAIGHWYGPGTGYFF